MSNDTIVSNPHGQMLNVKYIVYELLQSFNSK